MERKVLAAASFYKQKMFENPDFSELPSATMREVKALCQRMAEQTQSVFVIGFYGDGSLFLEARTEDGEEWADEQVKQAVDEVKILEKELIRELRLWYALFKTSEGEKIRDELSKGASNERKKNV